VKIIVDTREKKPWNFSSYDIEIVSQKLDEGDYTTQAIYDLEKESGQKILRIERKKSVSEIAGNLGKSTNRERFYREMERLEDYEFKYIIMEFPTQELARYPYGAGIPKKLRAKIKMRGKYILSLLDQIEADYGVEILYCQDVFDAQEQAIQIIQEVHDAYKI